MEGLRMVCEQITTFARVLRDLEGLCVTCNLRTNHVQISYGMRPCGVYKYNDVYPYIIVQGVQGVQGVVELSGSFIVSIYYIIYYIL